MKDKDEINEVLECFYNKKEVGQKKKLVSLKDRDKVIDISNALSSIKQSSNDIYSDFMKFINDDQDISKNYSLIKKLRQKNNILSKLVAAYIYFKLNNISRGNKILSEIMSHEFIYHIFSSDLQQLSLKKQLELFKTILLELEVKSKNSKIFQNLLVYLVQGTNGYFSKMLYSKFDISTNIGYVRKKYNSNTYGKEYPYVWGPIVYEKSSVKELKDFNSKLQLSDLLSRRAHYLLFYRIEGTREVKDKNHIKKSFLKIFKSNDPYLHSVFFRLMDSKSFYSYITANTNISFGLLINKKRKFYKKNLSKNIATTLSLIQLTAMGDFDLDYLDYLEY